MSQISSPLRYRIVWEEAPATWGASPSEHSGPGGSSFDFPLETTQKQVAPKKDTPAYS